MFQRQTSGSVVCPNCGRLVGVQDAKCLSCGRANPSLWGWAPALNRLGRDFGFTQLVIGGCVAMYLLTLVYAPDQIRMSGLMFLAPGQEPLFLFGMSGAAPVFGAGRWWTILSAAWLHGGLLHILLNMMWIRQLTPVMAETFGVARLTIIYTVSSAAGFLLTSVLALLPLPGVLQGASATIGASAPLLGLFGALFCYGHRTGNRYIGQQLTQTLIMIVGFGLLVPGVDNWAHVGGFAGGYLAARLLDPLRGERQEHLIAALVCLVAMAASIVVSYLDGLKYLS